MSKQQSFMALVKAAAHYVKMSISGFVAAITQPQF